MDIIQELDNLIEDVHAMASHSVMLPTSPPQHPFAMGTSVEQVINKINLIKAGLVNIKQGSENKSAAARRLRAVVDHGDWSSDQIQLLLEIANMMDNECHCCNAHIVNNYDQSHTYFEESHIYSSDKDIPLAMAFIKSYVEHNGPCTKAFIEGLYSFISKLDNTLYNNEIKIKTLQEKVDHSTKIWTTLLERSLRHC